MVRFNLNTILMTSYSARKLECLVKLIYSYDQFDCFTQQHTHCRIKAPNKCSNSKETVFAKSIIKKTKYSQKSFYIW